MMGHRLSEQAREPKTDEGGHYHSTRKVTCHERSLKDLGVDTGEEQADPPVWILFHWGNFHVAMILGAHTPTANMPISAGEAISWIELGWGWRMACRRG